jgi:dihydrofolate reductase
VGKLVVTEFITLDGVIEDPGGGEKDRFDRGGWAFEYDRGPDGETFKLDELMAADVQLLGRVTYEGFAKAWPAMEETTGEFGKKMNAMPKVVVSTTLTEATWNNTTIVRADVPEKVRELKQSTDGDVLVAGSATLVQTLLHNELVDQLNLMVFPVLLGKGKKLFADTGDRAAFEVAELRRSGEVAIVTLTRR